MWANAQRDGRPAEYRWRPLFNVGMRDIPVSEKYRGIGSCCDLFCWNTIVVIGMFKFKF